MAGIQLLRGAGARASLGSVTAIASYVAAHPSLVLGLPITAINLVLVLIGPVLAPWNPSSPDPNAILVGPNAAHLFGTDTNGLDVLSRVIVAPRVDMTIGLIATAISMVTGVVLGAFTGYFGGTGGVLGFGAALIMRVADIFQSIPVFVLAMALLATAGPSETNIIVAIAFVSIPIFLRLTRAEVRSLSQKSFLDAARVAGCSDFRIAFVHLMPNAVSPALVQASVNVGFAILLTAGLSFIGAGVRPPTSEWGLMISSGANELINGAWWPALFPGVWLALTVLAFALIGDALRAAFAGDVGG